MRHYLTTFTFLVSQLTRSEHCKSADGLEKTVPWVETEHTEITSDRLVTGWSRSPDHFTGVPGHSSERG